ncbi:hypothetical protein [Enterovirga sp.]|uniref:hypothetical protein n=1 Tax=Enterovirga sp. TaxID=2026350 RepID=UPI002607E322|nr:hypothetical protein [Enterovirga sp.]MDB5591625.1 hypothetical protein [Enterovirga sp.]
MRDPRVERLPRAGIREERLRATAGLRGGEALTSWRGLSGRRYVVGVHAIDPAVVEDATDAVLIAVQRSGDGNATVVDVATPGAATSRRSRLRWLARMRIRGATEMHVHLLAEDEGERRAVARDLAERSRMSP